MIRKSITLILFTFLLPLLLYSSESKTYKIGCNENYYPYISENAETDELEGVIIDWWKLWAKKTNTSVEFIPLDLNSCIEKVKTREIDAVAGLFFSDERATELLYAEPILRMKSVLFLKKGNKPDSLQAITNKIGVLKTDLALSFLQKNYPEISLDVYDNFYEMQSLVRRNNIPGFVYDIPNPLRNYKEIEAPKGYYIYKTLYEQKLRPAVRADNNELLNLISAGATKMTDDELLEIAERWELFETDRTMFLILLIIGAVLGILFALFLTHFFRSKRKVKLLEDNLSKTDWKLIIDKGENDKIEFKSSVRWDYRQAKANKVLEKVIGKTILAFLNTDGGMLFIGVDDDGNILGLENDYNCLSKKNRDGFLLNLTNIINVQLGKSLHKFIQINIISINEKEVCIVTVESSDKPVFLGKSDNEEFYIRASASSQPLGIRETYKYINSHWK